MNRSRKVLKIKQRSKSAEPASVTTANNGTFRSKREPYILIKKCGHVPMILVNAAYIIQSKLKVPDLFQIQGSMDTVEYLMSPMWRKCFKLSDGNIRVHDVAEMIKVYLSRMSNEIIPDNVMTRLIYLHQRGTTSDYQEVISLYWELSPNIVPAVHFVLQLLNKVSQHSDINGMDTRKLATIFVLDIIKPLSAVENDKDYEKSRLQQVHNLPYIIMAIEYLIRNIHLFEQAYLRQPPVSEHGVIQMTGKSFSNALPARTRSLSRGKSQTVKDHVSNRRCYTPQLSSKEESRDIQTRKLSSSSIKWARPARNDECRLDEKRGTIPIKNRQLLFNLEDNHYTLSVHREKKTKIGDLSQTSSCQTNACGLSRQIQNILEKSNIKKTTVTYTNNNNGTCKRSPAKKGDVKDKDKLKSASASLHENRLWESIFTASGHKTCPRIKVRSNSQSTKSGVVKDHPPRSEPRFLRAFPYHKTMKKKKFGNRKRNPLGRFSSKMFRRDEILSPWEDAFTDNQDIRLLMRSTTKPISFYRLDDYNKKVNNEKDGGTKYQSVPSGYPQNQNEAKSLPPESPNESSKLDKIITPCATSSVATTSSSHQNLEDPKSRQETGNNSRNTEPVTSIAVVTAKDFTNKTNDDQEGVNSKLEELDLIDKEDLKESPWVRWIDMGIDLMLSGIAILSASFVYYTLNNISL